MIKNATELFVFSLDIWGRGIVHVSANLGEKKKHSEWIPHKLQNQSWMDKTELLPIADGYRNLNKNHNIQSNDWEILFTYICKKENVKPINKIKVKQCERDIDWERERQRKNKWNICITRATVEILQLFACATKSGALFDDKISAVIGNIWRIVA